MKNKGHLDVVVKYFYPVAAGIETNVLETYSVLAEKGWDVTIHTSRDEYLQKGHLPANDTYRGLKIKRYSFTKFGYFPDIDWDSTDLVCLHNFDIFPHLRILLYTLGRKIIKKKKYSLMLTPHGGFNPEWSVFPWKQRLIKPLYHFTVGTLLINLVVDGARAVSNWERAEMIKKGVMKSKVVTIDNGIEDEAYKDVEKLASKEIKDMVKSYGDYIIQVGRIYPIKNYETTLKALAKNDKLHYVIAGPISDSEYFKQLNAQIKELKLTKRVHFVGVIRGIDKYYLIKKAQMMVHMAIWESFCNVVHEGLSQGLVCIVANNTALPFLIKDSVNGYCVKTKDADALAEKINFVYENQNTPFVVKMKEVNRKYGLENSWRKVAARMDSFYRKTHSTN